MNGLYTNKAIHDGRIAVSVSFPQGVTSRFWTFAASEKLLLVLFLLMLPLANPWVRGDGIGYYAYLRSALIDHDLRFENDYLAANESFVNSRVDEHGRLLPNLYTKTGYVENHFSVGPAILWAPVMLVVHGAVLVANRLGAHVLADGYSRPYLLAMALTTGFYGFLSLIFAFRITRKYFSESTSLLATIGIWLASSLPVYMYFNPSWSHAFSAFTVAVFLWHWERTRMHRTVAQWAILGLLAGLMGDVYYPNAILLIFPALEIAYLLRKRHTDLGQGVVAMRNLVMRGGVFFVSFFAALLPTFLTRQIIYGSTFATGYPAISSWNWGSPALRDVLFSSDHGLFSWTPILFFAVAGLPLLIKRDFLLGVGSVLTFLAYYFFIASYPDWDGVSSFGNRFFVSLTPIFILGLAALLDFLWSWLEKKARARALASLIIALFIVWNVGFMFQWGTHMVPVRGKISWRTMVHNQFVEVPQRMSHGLDTYFLHRSEMMQHIEREDIEQQKQSQ